MNLDKRFLPSMSALRVFEAMARLGSATQVARELGLTQSAVSRQLQGLETQLGTRLFHRQHKQITLLPEAEDLVDPIRSALEQIARATMRATLTPGGGAVHLSILPTFGMQWLVPRLPAFARAHPDITVNMSTALTPGDIKWDTTDAALFYGDQPPPECNHVTLRHEQVIAVAAPDFLADHIIAHPQDLLDLPLMHIQTRPQAWADWFEGFGVAPGRIPGTQYDQFATILQAAVHGLGVALLPDYLAQPELKAARLAAAYGPARAASGAYRLIWPKGVRFTPAMESFRRWMETQAEDADILPR